MSPVTSAVPSLAPLLSLQGVGEAADSARVAVDTLLRHRILRRRAGEVSAESLLRGARASAALAGARRSLDDVRRGDPDPVVQGALRANEAVAVLAETWRHAPAQALARLHLLAAAGSVPDDEVGRPVADAQVAARIDALLQIAHADSGVPAVVEAAVVHAEISTLQAFGPASGIVARAASRLITLTRGLDSRSLTVPELGHLEAGADYRAALTAYAEDGPDGVARWLRHCCDATVRGAQEGLAICEALARS